MRLDLGKLVLHFPGGTGSRVVLQAIHLTKAKPFTVWASDPTKGMTKLGVRRTLGDGFYAFVPPLPPLWAHDRDRTKMRVRVEAEVVDLSSDRVPAKVANRLLKALHLQTPRGIVWRRKGFVHGNVRVLNTRPVDGLDLFWVLQGGHLIGTRPDWSRLLADAGFDGVVYSSNDFGTPAEGRPASARTLYVPLRAVEHLDFGSAARVIDVGKRPPWKTEASWRPNVFRIGSVPLTGHIIRFVVFDEHGVLHSTSLPRARVIDGTAAEREVVVLQSIQDWWDAQKALHSMPKRAFVLVDIRRHHDDRFDEWTLDGTGRVSYLDPVLRVWDTPDRLEFHKVRMKPGALHLGRTLSGVPMIAFPGDFIRRERP
jgi:hypothetical protein